MKGKKVNPKSNNDNNNNIKGAKRLMNSIKNKGTTKYNRISAIPNPFILFRRDILKQYSKGEIKLENTGQQISEMWSNASEETIQKYRKIYKELKSKILKQQKLEQNQDQEPKSLQTSCIKSQIIKIKSQIMKNVKNNKKISNAVNATLEKIADELYDTSIKSHIFKERLQERYIEFCNPRMISGLKGLIEKDYQLSIEKFNQEALTIPTFE
tara:strand:+ start:687 stop:1322 length:636 start_codon:yes stop_codon:yes gene_type:complete